MARKTPTALAMDEVARRIAPVLKQAGFRKRHRAFNRTTEPGVVQVISFQMSDAGNGRFTLNLGVYVEALRDQFSPWTKMSAWVNEYNCQLRKRIGQLLPGGRDTWWQVEDVETAAITVQAALSRYGLPWLEQRRTQTAIFVDTQTAAHAYWLEHRQRHRYLRTEATACTSSEEAQSLLQQVVAHARARPGFALQCETEVPNVGDEAVHIFTRAEDAADPLPDHNTLVVRKAQLVVSLQALQPADSAHPDFYTRRVRKYLRHIQRRYVERGRAYPLPISFTDND